MHRLFWSKFSLKTATVIIGILTLSKDLLCDLFKLIKKLHNTLTVDIKELTFVLFTTFIQNNFTKIGATLAVNVCVAIGALACVSIDVIIALSAVLTRIAFTFVHINCSIKQTDNECTLFWPKFSLKQSHSYNV